MKNVGAFVGRPVGTCLNPIGVGLPVGYWLGGVPVGLVVGNVGIPVGTSLGGLYADQVATECANKPKIVRLPRLAERI